MARNQPSGDATGKAQEMHKKSLHRGPFVILALSLEGDVAPNAQAWREWIVSQIPPEVLALKAVKLLSGFPNQSSVFLMQVPLQIWLLLPDRPAYRFVGIVSDVDEATPAELLVMDSSNTQLRIQDTEIQMEAGEEQGPTQSSWFQDSTRLTAGAIIAFNAAALVSPLLGPVALLGRFRWPNEKERKLEIFIGAYKTLISVAPELQNQPLDVLLNRSEGNVNRGSLTPSSTGTNFNNGHDLKGEVMSMLGSKLSSAQDANKDASLFSNLQTSQVVSTVSPAGQFRSYHLVAIREEGKLDSGVLERPNAWRKWLAEAPGEAKFVQVQHIRQ
jgi:hypothetical protein